MSEDMSVEELIADLNIVSNDFYHYTEDSIRDIATQAADKLQQQAAEIERLKQTLISSGFTKKEGAYAWKPPLNTKMRDIRIENQVLRTQVAGLEEQLMEHTKQAFNTLKDALNKDESYAWSWHCNIAMMCYDAMDDTIPHEDKHRMGNDGASRFMKLCFNVDSSNLFPTPEDRNE